MGPSQSHAPVIRVYKNFDAWFGENRDHATLEFIGKDLEIADDYFVHPISDLSNFGIPDKTSVVLITSASAPFPDGFDAVTQQNDPVAQENLDDFVRAGGVLILDLANNLGVVTGSPGYLAPGAMGTVAQHPAFDFPSDVKNATLAPAALGADGMLGTEDDHPIVIGPDGLPGTDDDLNNENIDLALNEFIAHGNLVDGIMLPPNATYLMTAGFGDPEIQKPILAEYCLDAGLVILDTITKEFFGHQGPVTSDAHPTGSGADLPTFFMRNLFTYALSDAATAACAGEEEEVVVDIDIKPWRFPNKIFPWYGLVSVAIFGSADFDVDDPITGVDTTTLGFGPAGGAAFRWVFRGYDFSHPHDGHNDLIVFFRASRSGIQCGDTEAGVTGSTFLGDPIVFGTDSIVTVGCFKWRPPSRHRHRHHDDDDDDDDD